MSHCRVFVRKEGRLAFVRKAGNLTVPLIEVNGTSNNRKLSEALTGASGANVSQPLISNDNVSTVLVDVVNDECTIPCANGNEPIWVDAQKVTDQAIGMIAKELSIDVEDMDLVRRNFTLLSA